MLARCFYGRIFLCVAPSAVWGVIGLRLVDFFFQDVCRFASSLQIPRPGTSHGFGDLPQADRVGIQKLHDAIQTATDWRAVAGSLELATRILEKAASLSTSGEEIQQFQTLNSSAKEECKQLKTVAHFRLFDNMDAIDKQVDSLARHRDGSSFIVSRDGLPGLSEALE